MHPHAYSSSSSRVARKRATIVTHRTKPGNTFFVPETVALAHDASLLAVGRDGESKQASISFARPGRHASYRIRAGKAPRQP